MRPESLRTAAATTAFFVLASIGIAMLPATPAAATTPLFGDGFETGDLSAWTVNSGVTAQPKIVHEGSWAARATSAGTGHADAYDTLGAPVSEIYVRTWFELVSRSTPVTLLRLRTATGASILTVAVNANGRLGTDNTVTGVAMGSPVAVGLGSWRAVEIHALIAGPSSRVDVWLGGAHIDVLSHLDNLGVNPIGRVEVGEAAAGRKYDVAFDDVAADTAYLDDGSPTTPGGLMATPAGPSEIDLSWRASSDDVGISRYEVDRSTGSGFVLVGTSAGTTFADTSLSPSTTYTYEVLARDGDGNASALSGPVAATTPAGTDHSPPSVPTGLTATGGSPTRIRLTWTASHDDQGVTGYTVYRFDGVAYQPIATVAVPGFTDTGLAPSTNYGYEVDASDAAGNHSASTEPVFATTSATSSSPIRHVVVIDLENHSFDSILGKLCTQLTAGSVAGHAPCDGSTTARLSTGQVISLATSPDIVPAVNHNVSAQVAAVDGGRMDGFDRISDCTKAAGYPCLTQYDPSQMPNITALADRFVISDRTFEYTNTPSWVGHLVLAAASSDGFLGDNPLPSTFTTKTGPGWGCDSFKDARWWSGSQFITVPSCIPDPSGKGPYRSSPVPYVPTIFDRIDAAALTWKIYGGLGGPGSGYGWTICPTFYECLGSSQRSHFVAAANVTTDAAAGTLPNLSIVTPTNANSEHNGYSMAVGDNWIGQVVGAIEHGPDWASTAVFITWDDCGCFYDHVPPAFAGLGIRVPMVIASPYARPGATDSADATYASILAFVEHTFVLSPLSTADAGAYDYANAFDFSQTPAMALAPMVHTKVPSRELRWIAAHPDRADDPT
jgi:phospholipase C